MREATGISPIHVGIATAGAAAIVARGPMLLPRGRTDQLVVSALAAGVGLAAGSSVERFAGAADTVLPGDRQDARWLLAGAGGATAGTVHALRRSAGKFAGPIATAGAVLAAGAAAGGLLAAGSNAAVALDPQLPGGEAAARAAVIGAGALAVGTGLAARFGGLRRLLPADLPRQIDVPTNLPWKLSGNRSTQPLESVSGGPGSLLPRTGLTALGERFVDGAMPAATIRRVMGDAAATDPIRVAVGLGHGDSPAARAAAGMAELERLGAFEPGRVRSIVMYGPSGTGFVNPVAPEAVEFMERGRTAGISFQYATKPSFIALFQGKVKVARETYAAFLEHANRRIAAMPAESRPELRIVGESLGAHGSQDLMLDGGLAALRDTYGVDRAMWSGSPGFSKARHQVFGPDTPDYLARERVREIPGGGGTTARETKGADDLMRLSKAERDRLRVTFLSHPEDPVVRVSLTNLARRAPFLGASRAPELPAQARHSPIVAGLQSLYDGKNGAVVIPGAFGRSGHEYRADLGPVIRIGFGFEDAVSPKQLSAIQRALMENEIDYNILYRGITTRPAPASASAPQVSSPARTQHYVR